MSSRVWQFLSMLVILVLVGGMLFPSAVLADAAVSYEFSSVRKVSAKADFALVTDVLTVTNRGNTSMSGMNLKMGAAEWVSLFSMSAKDSAGRGLSYTQVGPALRNHTQLRMDFASPLVANGTVQITVLSILKSFLRVEPTAALDTYNFTIYPALVPDATLKSVRFEMALPTKASIIGSPQAPYQIVNQTTVTGAFTNLNPALVQPLFLEYTYASRDEGSTDVISPMTVSKVFVGSAVEVESQVTLRNVGKIPIGVTPKLKISLPGYVEEISRVWDLAGDLPTAPITTRDDRSLNSTITLRYNIDEGENYVFNIKYRLKSDGILERSGDVYNITLSTLGFYEPLVVSHIYSFVVPEGGGGVRADQPFSSIEEDGDATLYSFEFHNGSAYVPNALNVGFYVAGYWGILKQVFYWSLVYSIVVAVGAVIWHQIPKVPAKAKVVSESLRKLCDLYEEKTALRVEVDKLEDSLRRGKISKPIYDKRKQELARSIETMDRQLESVKVAVRKETPKHSRAIDELERTETEFRTLHSSIEDLRSQYEVRRVSRKVYEDLMYDYERKTAKIRSRVDAMIITLREDLA